MDVRSGNLRRIRLYRATLSAALCFSAGDHAATRPKCRTGRSSERETGISPARPRVVVDDGTIALADGDASPAKPRVQPPTGLKAETRMRTETNERSHYAELNVKDEEPLRCYAEPDPAATAAAVLVKKRYLCPENWQTIAAVGR